MNSSRSLAAAFMFAAVLLPGFAAEPSWVAKSNTNALLLLQTRAKYSPESASSLGLEEYDEQISDLSRDLFESIVAETDPRVQQDLQILIGAGEDDLRSTALRRKYFMPFVNVTAMIFGVTRE